MDANYTIDEFIEVKTKITGTNEDWESSSLTGIVDLFNTHLANTFNDPEKLRDYGNEVYQIKKGDKFTFNPSDWTVRFCEEKRMEIGDSYNFTYEIVDVIINYYLKNPVSDSHLPSIIITVMLERV